MKTSESIENIAKALCKFQTEIKDAHKDSQAHKYRYADLGTILVLVRPVMASNSLSAVQMTCNDGDRVGVTTRLMHNSGEWVESSLFMGVSASAGMSLAQSAGSVITYCRRYSLAAALGITQTDDDAVVEQPVRKKPEPKKPEPKVVPATEKQFADINAFVKDKQIPARTLEWLKVEKNWEGLTSKQANDVIKLCEDMK